MTALDLAYAIGETEDRFAETVFSPPAKKRIGRPIRTALILAAVLVLLALLLGVAARETGFLERLFPAKYEAIEDYVNHLAVSVENDGLRLTLHEAVTDGYNTMLIFSVELLNGDSMNRWDKADFWIVPLSEEGVPVVRGGGSGGDFSGPDRGVGNPNRIVYYWYNKCQTSTGRISVRLFGLVNYTTGERFQPGYLEAEAKLKPCLTKVSRVQGKETGEEPYSNIVLSPLGLRVDVAGVDMEKLGSGRRFPGKLEYVYREGEEEQVIDGAQVLGPDPAREDTAVLSVSFRQPVDIRGIVALRIDGVEYPLETGALPKRQTVIARPAEVPEISAGNRQELRGELFADCEPADVKYYADTGVYRLQTESLALWGDETELHLRAWVTAAALKGEYDKLLDLGNSGIRYCLLIDGRAVDVSGAGFGVSGYYDGETGERVFLLRLDFTGETARKAGFDGDFGRVSALRLLWTPPKGDRIALDLERTE